VEQRIVPALGSTPLADLSTGMLSTAYASWLADGLSPTYVQLIHQVINKALGDAERQGLIPRNPARNVEAPRKATLEMRTWTASEAGRFLAHVAEERLFAMWRLFLTTGMRRGEIAALRWSDVDLEHGRLSVRQTGNVIDGVWTVGSPKGRGRGATHLLSLDAETVRVLRTHQDAQLAERAELPEVWQEGTSSSAARTAPRSTPRASGTCSLCAPAGPVCRPSACTTCGTPTRPWLYSPASTPRWSASDSATPTSASR
jgi:integrase